MAHFLDKKSIVANANICTQDYATINRINDSNYERLCKANKELQAIKKAAQIFAADAIPADVHAMLKNHEVLVEELDHEFAASRKALKKLAELEEFYTTLLAAI